MQPLSAMHPKQPKLRLLLCGLLLSLLCSGCSTVRGAFLGMRNANLEGQRSPGLLVGVRLSAPTGSPQSALAAQPQWSLWTFFLPT